MFLSGVGACLGVIRLAFVVVDVARVHELSSALLAGEMVRTSFFFRLGSVGALWRYAIYKETKALCLDEMVREEVVAAFGMGG